MAPSGQITFLFTDIEGSTRLWEADPVAMRAALVRHAALLRAAIERRDGYVFKTMGDEFCAVFADAGAALRAALEGQRALSVESWPAQARISVRMGLHTGYAEEQDGDYFGPPINHVARLMSAGHGGQVLLSAAARTQVRDALPEGVSLRDLGEWRLRDIGRTEHIYQVDAPGLPRDFPPLRAVQTFLNNLPVQLTSFIGREKELAEVKRLLHSVRLLTLTGPGGTGKTRLALQAAVDMLDAFDDGVWLVELAALADPLLLPRCVADALRLREESGRPITERLIEFLRPRQVLLMLDNCEHLVDACAELVETLLRQCPRVTILATSRETLGIAGETAFRVPSLACPDPRRMPPVEQLADLAAVRLFAERARAVLPGFAVSAENAAAVAQICTRLDGIPLALELAAARVGVLREDQIAARLDDRFRLLTGGSRTALPRQQTLQALIDWSWDLLDERERVCLQRLSVFAGGWMLETAEAVCAGAPLERAEVLDTLTALANKSLVVVDRQTGADARYRLLETIRQYARDKLLAAGEIEAVRARHARWFAQWAEAGVSNFKNPRIVRWIDLLEVEYGNLRVALEWLLGGKGDALLGLRLAGALGQFWQIRAYLREGREWLESALAQTATQSAFECQVARARTQMWCGCLGSYQGDVQAAEDLLAAAARFYRRAGAAFRLQLAETLWLHGYALLFQGDAARAGALAEESVALCREAGRGALWHLANAMSRHAVFLAGSGQIARAAEAAIEAQGLLDLAGDRWNVASLALLAGLALHTGDYAQARSYYLEAYTRTHESNDKFALIQQIDGLAQVARAQGDLDEAIRWYTLAIEQWRDLGNPGGVARCLECLAFLWIDAGAPERATPLLAQAAALRAESGAAMLPEEREEYLRYTARPAG